MSPLHTPDYVEVPATYKSHPTDGVTRTSTTLGPLSTPWTLTVKNVQAGQVVELILRASMKCSADNSMVIGLAKGGNVIDRGACNTGGAATQNNTGILIVHDLTPTVGDNVYEVYVAANAGTITVMHQDPPLDTAFTTPFAQKGRSTLLGTAKTLGV